MKKIQAGLITVMVISSSFLWGQNRGKIDAWTVEADTLMDRQDFQGALPLLNNIINESKLQRDEDYLALYNRALCYFSIGEYDNALKDVNRYINKFPEQHALLLRMYIYQEQGNVKMQLLELDALIEQDPENAEYIQWRMSIYMDKGDYRSARGDIKRLLTIESTPELEAYVGLTYYYEDKPDSAIRIFDQVIKHYPEYKETYLYAGSLCVEQEAYDMALGYIDKGLHYDPTNTSLLFYKGVALVEKEKVKEGCRCLQKSFDGGNDDAVDYLKEYCYGVD